MSNQAITTAENIANFFLLKNKEENGVLSNKKLQKLLYYSQVWTLVNLKQPLFDNKIEAWLYGPVVPSIYHKYKGFGWANISKIEDFDNKAITGVKDVLLEVWSAYGSKDADYLVSLSHSEKPWQDARKKLDIITDDNIQIENKDMISFYSEFKNL